jgi:hypothetical protein
MAECQTMYATAGVAIASPSVGKKYSWSKTLSGCTVLFNEFKRTLLKHRSIFLSRRK